MWYLFVEEYKKLLNNITLLKDVDKDFIKDCFKTGQFRVSKYNKNTIVHIENDKCEKFEIILAGRVVVERLDESGGILTVAEFYENDVLGGNLLFSRNPHYPMTITTKQKTIVLEITKDIILKLCSCNNEFLKKFLEYVSDHTTMLSFKIKQHMNKTIRESLLIYLEHERINQNTNKIRLKMTKKELAEKIGVQRTSLSRELAKMKKDGIIDFDADSITVLLKDKKAK